MSEQLHATRPDELTEQVPSFKHVSFEQVTVVVVVDVVVEVVIGIVQLTPYHKSVQLQK